MAQLVSMFLRQSPLAVLLVLCIAGPSRADEAHITADDVAGLGGTQWRGVLRYLDYSTDVIREIPVGVMFEAPRSRSIVYRIRYPGEEQYNNREKLTWSRDGGRLNGKQLVRRSEDAGDGLTLVTEYRGKDDDRSADIRMTYRFEADAVILSKHVRFDGMQDYFERNAYVLRRVLPGEAGND